MQGLTTILPNVSGNVTHTTVNNGKWVLLPVSEISLELYLSAAGGTATVEVHGSNFADTTPTAATRMATFSLTGANDRVTLTKPDASYVYKSAVVTAISSATVTVAVGH